MQITRTEFNFEEFLGSRREIIELALKDAFVPGNPEKLFQSMAYSTLNGGKRIRALLTIACAEVLAEKLKLEPGKAQELILPLCCAIEMVHAMSLIHDDLPCLDNDDLRRGRPTNHKVYGEAMALLAGDGLLAFSNQILLEKSNLQEISAENLLAVSCELSRAIGPTGMVGGQVLDMEFTGSASSALSITTVEEIHKGKTGALIRFSLWAPGKLLGADEKTLDALSRLGEILGLAFQITDDLLDVTGDAKTLGKTPGKDDVAGKATFVRAIGMSAARAKLEELETEGMAILRNANLDIPSNPVLSSLLKYAIHRAN
jgi:geranylgeranyl diphosphate synthase type II